MKIRTNAEADVNITSLIDCLMQCIIFFMVVMSAQYIFGVAIKFPNVNQAAQAQNKEGPKEKTITVYVQSDNVMAGHVLVPPEGLLKINGEEIPLAQSADSGKWAAERKVGYDYLKNKIAYLIGKEGYKSDVITVQGDMKTYHGKIMAVIDKGKDNGIDGFSLVPPAQ